MLCIFCLTWVRPMPDQAAFTATIHAMLWPWTTTLLISLLVASNYRYNSKCLYRADPVHRPPPSFHMNRIPFPENNSPNHTGLFKCEKLHYLVQLPKYS
jgi:hypothetical protein